MASQHIQTFTDANFQDEVLNSDKPVLVDFWATWCQPCKRIMPFIDAIADKYAGQAKVGKLNVDDDTATAQQYGITSIPTVLVFKGGQPVGQISGAAGQQVFEKLLTDAL